MPECSITRKLWSELSTDELYAFIKLRTDVFLVEQGVDEEELDNRDQEPDTEHMWIADDRGTATYLRVLLDANPTYRDARRVVGRVVTRADRRGEGLAHQLMTAVIDRWGDGSLLLHAQEYIAPLYAKSGFVAFGATYLEAGISHIMMFREGSAAS
jgi:ElaA protein